ncbi:MAG: SufBD protein [Oscillospiraceae bacterium]|nr:SufBD protein [Oscillospiraceae bacterium]
MTDFARLRGKGNAETYAYLLELERRSAAGDELYADFDAFLRLLEDPSSCVRTRGFRLCCAQAPWDRQNKLKANADVLLWRLGDEKPAVVRQCLAALRSVLLYKPELGEAIVARIAALDLSKYKDSMRPLIEKDIAALRALCE